MSAFSSLEHSDAVLAKLEELAGAYDPERNFQAAPNGVLTATEVMVVAAALLKAVNVNVFELGLWQSWSA